jgi:hypothetical protein
MTGLEGAVGILLTHGPAAEVKIIAGKLLPELKQRKLPTYVSRIYPMGE